MEPFFASLSLACKAKTCCCCCLRSKGSLTHKHKSGNSLSFSSLENKAGFAWQKWHHFFANCPGKRRSSISPFFAVYAKAIDRVATITRYRLFSFNPLQIEGSYLFFPDWFFVTCSLSLKASSSLVCFCANFSALAKKYLLFFSSPLFF